MVLRAGAGSVCLVKHSGMYTTEPGAVATGFTSVRHNLFHLRLLVMDRIRQVNLSLAAIVAICFFLPWIQLSCAGAKDSQSGFDIARGGASAVWIVPLLMLVIIALGLRFWAKSSALLAIASVVGGLLTAYLMNDKRVEFEDASSLIEAHATGWYWLGFISSLGVAFTGLMLYLKKPPSH